MCLVYIKDDCCHVLSVLTALGFREPLGHIDFYPNAGTDQPGCPKTIFSGTFLIVSLNAFEDVPKSFEAKSATETIHFLDTGSSYFKCDHQRSVFLYMDSIKRVCELKAYPCESYRDFLDGLCTSCERFGDAGCPVFG